MTTPGRLLRRSSFSSGLFSTGGARHSPSRGGGTTKKGSPSRSRGSRPSTLSASTWQSSPLLRGGRHRWGACNARCPKPGSPSRSWGSRPSSLSASTWQSSPLLRGGRRLVRAEGVEPSSQAWEAHIIADILCPQLRLPPSERILFRYAREKNVLPTRASRGVATAPRSSNPAPPSPSSDTETHPAPDIGRPSSGPRVRSCRSSPTDMRGSPTHHGRTIARKAGSMIQAWQGPRTSDSTVLSEHRFINPLHLG